MSASAKRPEPQSDSSSASGSRPQSDSSSASGSRPQSDWGSASGSRTICLALCGGADRPDDEHWGGLTAFEAAPTPHLDELAAGGCSGLVDVIGDGVPPESDSGAMALLGYDPLVHYTGRGPLEGFGGGYWDPDGYSVAFRVNFASRDEASGRLDRRTSRDLTDPELADLVAEVLDRVHLDGVTVHLTGWGRHRGILAFTSRVRPLSGDVTNTDPGFVKSGPFGVPAGEHPPFPLPCRPLDADPASAATAELVDEFVARSAEVLAASDVNRRRVASGRKPANVLLVRDGGHRLPDLSRRDLPGGLRVSMYGQVPAERGLARLMGASFDRVMPAPGQSDRDFYARLVPALLADPADFVYVHVKGPDEPGHDGQPDAKVRAIADIDAYLVGPLQGALSPADTLVVTCDHATPCSLGIHSADPVPLTARGPGLPADGVTSFGERAAAGGGLPLKRACELLGWVLGARDGGVA